MLIEKEHFSLFESIGNNCEFGIFQRNLGFDPPGLFRNVGYLSPQQIIRCIANGLDKMFDAGTYKYVLPEGWSDWRLDCHIYGLGFHSRIPKEVEEGSDEWKKLTKTNIAQFKFLKNKFLDDLEDGEKIFVYRFKGFWDDSVAIDLLNAIRQHGTGKLLYVYENPLEKAPTFQIKSDGLLQASIHRLSNENPPQIDFDAWLKICRTALTVIKGIPSSEISSSSPEEDASLSVAPGSDDPALILDTAEKAAMEEEKRRNWPALLGLSQKMRLRFPAAVAAYRLEAKAQMELGRLPAAETLLNVALHLSAEDPALLRLRAELATRGGDAALALARWQLLAHLHPDSPTTVLDLAEAYQAAHQYDMADEQLVIAMDRAPGSASLAIKWALLALRRGNHEAALDRWQVVRDRFPDESEGYAAAGHNLRSIGRYEEADAVVEQGLARLPEHRELLTSHAWTATVKRDWPEAERRWRRVQGHWPTDGAMVKALADAIEQQGRRDEAEQLLREGMEALPDNPSIATALAERVLKRGDWSNAIDHFRAIITRFPDQARPYAAIGHALRVLRLYGEADKYTELGLARFPGHFDLLVSHAWTAKARGDWEQVAERWQIVRSSFPKAALAISSLAEALEKLGRAEEAEALLAQARTDIPNDQGIAETFAILATQAADWPAAIDRWQDVVTRFPKSGHGYHQLALALKKTGDMQGAERILDAGVAVAPDDVVLLMEHAWSASLRADWPEAIHRWEALAARIPDAVTGNDSAFATHSGAIQDGLTHARLGAEEAPSPDTGRVDAASGCPSPGDTVDGPRGHD
ncbi:tetratricopeptide TPR_2 [Nitrospirillum viridazoti Y2]|uniref:Flp pilus assembly protein TadD n=1 Tax=Nitrospirillum amazonense TaxID=28077 RepID=A0A560IC88_9PROT|nr:tetratricopeptide repeat protein [Nitrospirillum amazonense]EGY01072.1 tetratricopeptide TPR_2 [Nitrospirillum amazonense Y2]TWB56662.1 Flp pilus assembly protein TadD [Nitrospirillum amazonense]